MSETLKDVLQAATSELEFLSTKDRLNITDHDRHRRLIASLDAALDQLTKKESEEYPAEKGNG